MLFVPAGAPELGVWAETAASGVGHPGGVPGPVQALGTLLDLELGMAVVERTSISLSPRGAYSQRN